MMTMPTLRHYRLVLPRHSAIIKVLLKEFITGFATSFGTNF